MAQTILQKHHFRLLSSKPTLEKSSWKPNSLFCTPSHKLPKRFRCMSNMLKIRGTPLDNDKPWLVIDNIPNRAMNEKFLFSGNVPGMTAADLMKMITQYLDYKLPLLVGSAPTLVFNYDRGF